MNLLHSLHTENEASGLYLLPVLFAGALSPAVPTVCRRDIVFVCRRDIVFACPCNFNRKPHINRRGSAPPNTRWGTGNVEINHGSDSD